MLSIRVKEEKKSHCQECNKHSSSVYFGGYTLCRDCLLNFIDELKQALSESERV